MHVETAIHCVPLCEINRNETPLVSVQRQLQYGAVTNTVTGSEVKRLRGRGFIPTLIMTQHKANCVFWCLVFTSRAHRADMWCTIRHRIKEHKYTLQSENT